MWVFVDESGDAGLSLDQGASEYFTVILVCFSTVDAIDVANQRINEVRLELKFNPRSEFHFNKLRNDYREKFLQRVCNLDFQYYGIVLNKKKLTGPGFQFKESFYKYACNLVLQNALEILETVHDLSRWIRRRDEAKGVSERH